VGQVDTFFIIPHLHLREIVTPDGTFSRHHIDHIDCYKIIIIFEQSLKNYFFKLYQLTPDVGKLIRARG